MPSRRTSLPAKASSSTPTIDRLASSSQPPQSPAGRSRSARSASRQPHATPDDHPHHLSAADEQALLEAEKILSTPTRRLRSRDKDTPESVVAASLARDRRHLHLLEAREKEEALERISVGTHDTADEEDLGVASASLDMDDTDGEKEPGLVILGEEIHSGDEDEQASNAGSSGKKTISAKAGKASQANGKSAGEDDASEADTIARLDAADEAETSMTLNETENNDESTPIATVGDEESSEADSDSDSDDSDSESDSETSASEGDSDEEDERLEKLLQAAKISAAAKQKEATAPKGEDNGEVVLQFDAAEIQEACVHQYSGAGSDF